MRTNMAKYFDLFPQIAYDIDGKQLSTYQNVTNIFFRLRVVQKVLGNISAYYNYIITEGDTPEILAENIYGDPEAHWIILMANNIVDPQYDWPLSDRTFEAYIIGKYGSIETAQLQIHHYEKVIQREESASGIMTETRFVINQEKLTDNALDMPYDYYQGDGSLPETQSVNTYNLPDNRTVIETIFRDSITVYDYELNLNEDKRNIRIIKPEFYGRIIEEFNTLTENVNAPYLRKLR